jgi:hypothetical protein
MKKVGVAVHAAPDAADEIVSHPFRQGGGREVVLERLPIEAERGGVLQQVTLVEGVLSFATTRAGLCPSGAKRAILSALE